MLNTAARIQSAAPTDGILVSRTTYLATKDVVLLRRGRGRAGKGEGGAGRGLGGRRRAGRRQTHGRAARRRSSAATTELGELAAFCDACSRSASAGLAAIVGPPGIGKSRLLLELAQRLESRFDIHWGKCLSYGEGITYWPVVEIFKSAAGILQSDDRETIAARLDAFLEALPTRTSTSSARSRPPSRT